MLVHQCNSLPLQIHSLPCILLKELNHRNCKAWGLSHWLQPVTPWDFPAEEECRFCRVTPQYLQLSLGSGNTAFSLLSRLRGLMAGSPLGIWSSLYDSVTSALPSTNIPSSELPYVNPLCRVCYLSSARTLRDTLGLISPLPRPYLYIGPFTQHHVFLSSYC